MTDQELEQRLRDWYRAEIDDGEPAPFALRTSLAAMAHTPTTSAGLFGNRRSLTLLAAAMVTALLISGALAVGSGLVRLPSVLPPPPSPEASVDASSTPIPAPLGGGPILAHEFKRFGDPDPHGVFAIDAGTGERTLLGTLPGAAVTGSSGPYTFQTDADRTRVLISGGALQASTAASLPFGFIASDDLGLDGVLSPRGDRVAAEHWDEHGTPIEIVILDVASGTFTRLPVPAGMNWFGGLSWSPDESALVAFGCRPCNKATSPIGPQTPYHGHLYVVRLDGSPWRELLDIDNGGLVGVWSPDGQTLAVESYACAVGSYMPRCDPSETTNTLSTLSLTEGVQRSLGEVPGLTGVAWSPDGTRIAYGAQDGIYVVNADGSDTVKLADGVGYGADWSPDGQWLLLSRDGFGLWIAAADGGELRQIGTDYAGGTW